MKYEQANSTCRVGKFFLTPSTVRRAKCNEILGVVIKRIPEPELMQNLLQVKAYAEADFSESDDSFIQRIEKYLCLKGKKLDSQSLIVDLGSGPGNITERLSRRWASSKVIGIDGSHAMLAEARRRQSEAKSSNALTNITYYCWDISLIANGLMKLEKPADLIVSNSLLHHFHDPSNLWKALKPLSARSSVHLHRDLRRPSSVDELIALQKIYLPDSSALITNDYCASLKAAFTVAEVQAQLHSEGLDNLRVYELDDRYLEVVGNC